MASIKKYEAKRSKKGYMWKVQYRDATGAGRTKQGFNNRDEAEDWANRNAVDVKDGTWIDPALGKKTIADLHPTWVAGQSHLTVNTVKILTSTWNTHVKPAWGNRRIASIRPSEVQAWLGTIKKHTAGKNPQVTDKPASATTIRNCHQVLAQILDLAVTDRMIASNPARGMKLPKKPKGVKVYLTPQQLDRLVAECGENGDLILLLATAGPRFGEVAPLRPKDLNLLRRRVPINRNVYYGDDGAVTFGETKGGEKRTIAVIKRVADALEKRCEGKAAGEYLWTDSDGGPIRYLGHNSFFHNAVRRLQKQDSGFPSLTPHGLRHVAAGLMVQSGASVKVVQKQLGHESATMTLDQYADLFDGDLDEVADRMEEMFDRKKGTA